MSAATEAIDFFASQPPKTAVGSSAEAIPSSDLKMPLTVFYNGRVSVFQVSREQAEKIMRVACSEETTSLKMSSAAEQHNKLLLEKFNGGGVQNADQARRKSLQTFLAKRKQRVVSLSPYTPNSLNGPDCAMIKN